MPSALSLRCNVARNRRHNSWLIAATLVVSIGAHPGAALMYEMSRDPIVPTLRVRVAGEGGGVVHSNPLGIECGDNCSMKLEPGSLVELSATISEGSTFEGWDGPCGSQAHRLFGWAAEALFNDISIERLEERRDLLEFLVHASDVPLAEYPLECKLSLEASTEVVATFGVPPEVMEMDTISDPLVAQAEPSEETTVVLPKASWEPEDLVDLEELEAELEPEPEVPKPLPLPTPIQATVQPTPPAPKIAQTPKMKAVEVPDENEVEEAPADAKFLSDKNRDVAEETRAEETNLKEQSTGERVASAESTLDSEEIGAEEAEIAQLEDLEATSFDADRDNDESAGSDDGAVVMRRAGDDGDGGDDGEGGDDTPTKEPGLLAMRNIDGRGSLGSSGEPMDETPDADQGAGGERGRRGKRGRRGPKLQLDQEDYARIVGEEIADKEMAVAAKKQSRRRGRWERKLGMLKSSLENFTPEVRAGNQTALKTRAAPFALYIARMHRRIHELWGFGFLEELDSKPSGHALNNWKLAVKLEIVLNQDGSIDKMTIVNPSGVLPFDVAALDVIDVAGPYESTPEKIRSADGKVYMHWSFHRDWRQCGTFGAEPFILSSPGRNRDQGMDDTQLLRASPRRKKKRPAPPQASSSSSAAASARASVNMASPDDPAVQHAANLWLTAFVAGKTDKMAKLSSAPFRSGETIVARTTAEISGIYKSVISESPSRRIRDWKLLSAAGYRRHFGALPSGIDARGSEVYLVIRLKSDRFTLVLRKGTKGYRVGGLFR